MRKFFAVLLVILLASCQLPAPARAEGEEHTLVIAVSNPVLSDPRLEYAFLNRWPDGKIVYVEYDRYEDSSLQMLSGQFPDLILLDEGSLPRYDRVGLIEDLYERVFPDGYPETLAPQARQLMERDGRMVGISKGYALYCWEMSTSAARQLGLDMPAEDWTELDFVEQYLEGYTGDTNGDGVLDIWLMDSMIGGGGPGRENYILHKWVPMGMENALIKHMDDPDYFLTDGFLAELEVGKRVYQSDAILTHVDEHMNDLPTDGLPRRFLFETVTSTTGPYRKENASAFLSAQIPTPAFCSGELNQNVIVNVYALMRGAPHRELAMEVMRMMASEEYQAIYEAPGDTRRQHAFGAKEPTLQMKISGSVDRRDAVFYSEEYHADVRVVDAASQLEITLSDLPPSPETWQMHLDALAQLGDPYYDNYLRLEIVSNVFRPALREYFADNMTKEEVARLLYQRLRIAVYE